MRIREWSSDVCSSDLRPLPAQFGFHPALAWPLPFGEARGEHRITFDADEPERLLRIAPDGLIAPERRDSPLDGRTLHLDDALFTDDALVWDPVHSDKVRYGPAEGPAIEMGFPDTPRPGVRAEEHTSELQSLMRTSYAVFCLK